MNFEYFDGPKYWCLELYQSNGKLLLSTIRLDIKSVGKNANRKDRKRMPKVDLEPLTAT